MFQGKSKKQKLELAKNLFNDAVRADRMFQKAAMEDFEFRDGDQWDEDDKQYLAEEKRPCLTFPLIGGRVNLVKGMHEDAKIKYIASPMEESDDFLCEVINDTVEYVYEKAGTEAVEDKAFDSTVTCGRGWAGVSFDPDPKRLGHIRLRYNNPPVYEVHKDPASRKADQLDGGYMFFDKWFNQEDFKLYYPKFKRHVEDLLDTGKMTKSSSLSEFGTESVDGDFEDVQDVDQQDYDVEIDSSYFNRTKRQVRVVQMEYWETFKRYYTFDPETGDHIEFDKKNMKELRRVYAEDYDVDFEYVDVNDQKVKWLQFIGDKIVYDGDSPIPFDGFSLVQGIAYSDSSGRTTNNYGIVRPIKDSQREVNKRWSQSLNMINNNVQPGTIVEEGTFVDDEQGIDSLKTVGGVTMVKEDALKDKRIEVRSPPPFPVAAMQMEEAAKDMINEISGINPDLLGQDRGRVDSGVVVRLRQQQGLALLKTLMNSSRDIKKGVFERTVAIILAYMPDEQIVHILGDSERYVIQENIITDQESGLSADIRDVRNVKYNVKSEELPSSKSRRILELSVFMEMQQAGTPVDPSMMIDKTDISASEKKKWKEYLQRQEEAVQQKEEREYELEVLKIQSKMYTDEKKLDASTALGAGKLHEGIRKGDMKDAVDNKKLALEDKKMKLDFIKDTGKNAEASKAKEGASVKAKSKSKK